VGQLEAKEYQVEYIMTTGDTGGQALPEGQVVQDAGWARACVMCQMAAHAEARVQQRLLNLSRDNLFAHASDSGQSDARSIVAGEPSVGSVGTTSAKAYWGKLAHRWNAGREAVRMTSEERFGISHELLLQAMPFRSLHNPRRITFAWGITMIVFVIAAYLVILYSLFPCDQSAPMSGTNISFANATFGELAITDAFVRHSNGSDVNGTSKTGHAEGACLRDQETWLSVLKAWLLGVIVESVVSDPVMILSVLLTKASWSFCMCHEIIFKNRAIFACCSPLARVYDLASNAIGGTLGLL